MQQNYDHEVFFANHWRTVRLISFIILTLGLIVIDLIYSEDFMLQSIELSIWLQKYDLFLFSMIFSYIVIGFGFAFVFLHFFFSNEKKQSFLSIFGLMICVWLHGFAKLLYMDTRPSFLSKKLKSEDFFCIPEFGKPSGHALFSFYLFLSIGKLLEIKFFKDQSVKNFLCFLLNCLIAAIIGLTRFYFGVHSFNQVILGSFLGCTVFFVVDFVKDTVFLHIYEPIFEKKTRNVNTRKSLLVLLSIFAVLFVLSLTSFFRANSKLKNDTSFYENIINCENVKEDFIFRFTVKMEINCVYFIFFNFFFIGLLLNSFNVKEGLNFAYDGNFKFICARFAVLSLTFIPTLLISMVDFDHGFGNIVIQTFNTALISFLSGMYIFNLFEKLKIPFKKDETIDEYKEGTNNKNSNILVLFK